MKQFLITGVLAFFLSVNFASVDDAQQYFLFDIPAYNNDGLTHEL